MQKKAIVIGCDNAAVDLKKIVIKILEEKGFAYEDIGVAGADDNTAYPLIAQKVCDKIIQSGYQKEGVLLCGTGIGMCMCANKFPGIFAAVCHDNFSAERSRLSNNGNLICMGSRVIGPELAKKIMAEWLSTSYLPGGNSQSKVDAMRSIDADTRRAQISSS